MFAKLLERFGKEEVPEQNPQVKYRRLRKGIDGGYGFGSVIELTSFSTPLPASLIWLEPPNADPCERPPDGVVDGRIDVAQVFADEAQLAEMMQPKPALPDYTRAEMKELLNISRDEDLNFAEDLGFIPRHRAQFERGHEAFGGKVTAVNELWSRREVGIALEKILRVFPNALKR